jgi:ribose transport system substrate-binding protein
MPVWRKASDIRAPWRRRLRALTAQLVAALTLLLAVSSIAEAGAKGDPYTIGIVQFAASDVYSSNILNAIVSNAESNGGSASMVDSGGDVSKAITIMSNFVQQKVDIIITATYQPEQLQGGIAQAHAAGIPVVSVIGAGNLPGLVAYYEIGDPMGGAIVDQMEKDLAGKQVNLLEITYSPGTGCQHHGAKLEAWKKKTTSKIVRDSRNDIPIPGQVEAARTITAGWLDSSPVDPNVVNVVWACWDDPALGAVAALRAAERNDVLVYGATGLKAAIKAIQEGRMRFTVYGDVNQIADQVTSKLPGFIKGGADAPTQKIDVAVIPITRDNVAQFVAEHPKAVQ